MTERASSKRQSRPSEPSVLRGVLVEQYRLHEVRLHEPCPDSAAGGKQTVPKAHALADIYKCIHQGEFSVGHNIQDEERFGYLLLRDLLQAKPRDDEPLLENVSPQGLVFRVNLRPYRSRFLGQENRAAAMLFRICLESALLHQGTVERFIGALGEFRDLNAAGKLTVEGLTFVFSSAIVEHFFTSVKEFIAKSESIPVLSHSEGYRAHNNPSYRVVSRAALEHSSLARLLGEMQ